MRGKEAKSHLPFLVAHLTLLSWVGQGAAESSFVPRYVPNTGRKSAITETEKEPCD